MEPLVIEASNLQFYYPELSAIIDIWLTPYFPKIYTQLLKIEHLVKWKKPKESWLVRAAIFTTCPHGSSVHNIKDKVKVRLSKCKYMQIPF